MKNASILLIFISLLSTANVYAQSTGDFRSFQTGNWNDVTSWERYDGVGWVTPAPHTPTASDGAVSILNGDTIAVSADTTVDQVNVNVGGVVSVNALVTLRIADGAEATDMAVNGLVISAGTVAPSGVLSIENGGVYRYTQGPGLPTATWQAGSTCEITGVVGTVPANGNQNFHHLVWNCPTQTGNLNMGWNGITIGGNITIVSTGTGRWQLAAPTAGSSAIITIMGDVTLQSGNFTTNGTSNGNTTIVVNHYGHVTATGGNFSISRGSQGGTGTSTWYLHNGNFTMSNATTQNSNAAGAKFVFARGGAQSLTLSGVIFAGGGLPLQVDSGAILHTNTSVIRGSGAFTLNAGATLACGHEAGLDSALQNTGTRTLSAGAGYTFNATAPQVTGALLPASINNLTIDNASSVTLTSTTTVNGTFALTSGNLITGSDTLILGTTGSVARTSGHVVGMLQKNVAAGSNVTRTFEVGSGNSYAPIDVTLATVTTAGDLIASTTGNDHPNIGTSGIDSTKSVNRYWSLANMGIGFTAYDAVFNFVSGDIDAGANPNNFIAAKYDGVTWSSSTEGIRTSTSLQVLGEASFSDFAVGQAPSVTIHSNGTGGGSWSSTTTWQGGIVPTAIDSVVILGSDSVYVLANSSCVGLYVQSGGKLGLTAKLSIVNVTLAGKVSVHADTLNTSGAVSVIDGGIYHNARNGGRIPTASWGTGSTCLITDVTTTAPGNGNQNFHHVVWNCPAQTSNVNMGWNNITIGGNITILNTNTGRWQMCAPTAGNSATVAIMGDVLQSGGNFSPHGTGNAGTTIVINHQGNVNVTGGNFSISRGSQGGTGTTTWYLHNGDFSMSNATTQNSNVAGAKFVLSKTGPHSVSFANDSLGSSSAVPIQVSNGSITSLTLSNINYAGRGFPVQVDSGGTLSMGTTVLAGNGTFLLNAGATIESGHASGLNGNLTNTGTTTLSAAAGYTYNGSAAQITGSLLPGAVAGLTINNANGVVLSDTTTATAVLNLTAGILHTGVNVMTVGSGGVVNRINGHVNGYLRKTISSPSDSRTFETGDASVYTPVVIAGASYSGAFDITASTTTGDHPNISTSGIDSSRSVNRYYTLSGTPTGPSDITFNFIAGDVDAGANPGNFLIEKYDGSWSSTTVGARTATSTQALGVTSFSDFALGEPPPIPPTTIMSNGTGGGEWGNGTTWAGGVPPGPADTVVIVGTDSVDVAIGDTCSDLTVQSAAKLALVANLTSAHASVAGTVISNTGGSFTPTAGADFASGSVYKHAQATGGIPTATWGVGSTVEITGVTSSSPSNGNQSFHHVIWNNPAQTSNLNMGWDGNTIGGNITVLSTGTGRWQMAAPVVGDTSIITIMGDVIQSAGNFTTNGTSNGNTTIVINHHGNINVTGGNFSISRGSQGGTGTSTWFLHDGNLTMVNATTQNSNSAGGRFVFTKPGTQNLFLASVTFAGGGLPAVVDSGTMLNTGTSVIRGSGVFTLNATATLACGHPGGLDSLLQNTGARTLSSDAGYTFNGTLPQITGALLPATVGNLTMDNDSGATLSAGTTVNGTLTLARGDLNLNGNTITLGPNALLSEMAGNTVTGATGIITTTRTLNVPNVADDIAGLGVRIGSSANLGTTVISRGHGIQSAGSGSIKRFFDITPTNNTGLNATFVFRYDDSELSGEVDSTLRLFRSTDAGSSWTQMGGTVNGTTNTITLTGVNTLSRWTAAVPVLPPLPAQVVLISPVHAAVVNADSVVCVWLQSTPAVMNYWFERATDSLFTANRLIDSTLIDTSTITRQLVNNQTYWWRVRAKNAAGWGPFSTARRFIVIITGVGDELGVPAGFSLKQNYPNPFNPSTTIKFSVETSGRASLEVYNLLGQKMLTLFDEEVEPGRYYVVKLNGQELSSGMYLYRLQSGRRSEIKKLLLLK